MAEKGMNECLGVEEGEGSYRIYIGRVFYVDQLFPKFITDKWFYQFQRCLYP